MVIFEVIPDQEPDGSFGSLFFGLIGPTNTKNPVPTVSHGGGSIMLRFCVVLGQRCVGWVSRVTLPHKVINIEHQHQ